MELKTMKTRTGTPHLPTLRSLKLAALAIGSSFVLAGCAGNPPTEQYAVTQSAVNERRQRRRYRIRRRGNEVGPGQAQTSRNRHARQKV